MRLRDRVIAGKPTTAFRKMLNEGPCPVLGIWGATPHHAQLAEATGFQSFGVSGAMLSTQLLGLPDAGLLTLTELTDTVRRVCSAVSIPVTVDCDTGFGNAINVIRTVTSIMGAGAAAMFMEDQVAPKRCGFVKGKEIIPIEEAVGKYRAAIDVRDDIDPDFVIMARTDAGGAVGGSLDEVLRRGEAYLRAGVDVLYVEALLNREEMWKVRQTFPDALLMLTDFALDPPLSTQEMHELRVCTYPLFIARVASMEMYSHLLRLKEHGVEGERSYMRDHKDHPLANFGLFDLTGFPVLRQLEKQYLSEESMQRYEKSIGAYDPARGRKIAANDK
jgi:2-methylisocitrate lyase-like PEP mutase family enzyme